MIYAYKAANQSGLIIKGTIHSPNMDDVKSFFERQKLYLIQLKPYRQKIKMEFSKSISLALLEEFCFQMTIFLRSNLTVLEALKFIAESNNNLVFKKSLIQLIYALETGMSLSLSFKNHPKIFDPIFCSMILLGEQIGDFSLIFHQLTDYYKQRQHFKNQIWRSLQYPIILMMIILGLIGFLMSWTLPQVTDFFMSLNKDLPLSTRSLIFISQNISAIIFALITFIVTATGIILIVRFSSQQGKLWSDRLFLKIPLFGKMIRKIELHRFLQTFVTLFSSGISILQAIEIASTNLQNSYLKSIFEKVRKDITKGISFSQSWQQHLILDPLMSRLILTGESTGQLSQSLMQGADFLKRDIDRLSKKFIKTIEPVLMVLMGSILLWIIFAIFLPLYETILIV